MPENNHTPGPWRVWTDSPNKHLVHLNGAKPPYTLDMDHLPNLELAAAAPDMLDEIQRLRAALEWIATRCPKIYETSLDDPHRAHVEAAVDAGNCARAAMSPQPTTENKD